MDAHHVKGVDFLVDLHGAEPGGQGRARTPGHQHAGDQRRELAGDGQRDADGDPGLGAEDLERVDALDGQHDADGRGHDGDDGNGLDPDFHHLLEHRGDPYRLLVARPRDQPVQAFPHQRAAEAHFLDPAGGPTADAVQKSRRGVAGLLVRHDPYSTTAASPSSREG